jgi:hypothetical protein
MHTTTATESRPSHSHRPVPWRRAAGVAAGVLAVGGLGALVHDVTESSGRPAVVTPAAPAATSSASADASAIWAELLQLDAAEDAATRAGLSPELRAAVDELDRQLAHSEAARRAYADTAGITEMCGALWAAPGTAGIAEMLGDSSAAPSPHSTPGIMEMCNAFWAAPLPDPTLGITEMNGAFWAPSPPA